MNVIFLEKAFDSTLTVIIIFYNLNYGKILHTEKTPDAHIEQMLIF